MGVVKTVKEKRQAYKAGNLKGRDNMAFNNTRHTPSCLKVAAA